MIVYILTTSWVHNEQICHWKHLMHYNSASFTISSFLWLCYHMNNKYPYSKIFGWSSSMSVTLNVLFWKNAIVLSKQLGLWNFKSSSQPRPDSRRKGAKTSAGDPPLHHHTTTKKQTNKQKNKQTKTEQKKYKTKTKRDLPSITTKKTKQTKNQFEKMREKKG